MCAVRLAELERVTTFAKAIVTPLSEAWSRRARATVRIDTPQAAELGAGELGQSLEGWFWVLPVEVTGVYSGAFSLLIEQSLLVSRGAPAGATDEKSAGRFAAIIDEFLAAAADRLTAAVGSAITLDRLGLREVPGKQAAEILVEFLGRGEFVVVSFAAELGATRASDSTRSGGVAVVFGTGLAGELGGAHAAGAETVAPASSPPWRPRRARRRSPRQDAPGWPAGSTRSSHARAGSSSGSRRRWAGGRCRWGISCASGAGASSTSAGASPSRWRSGWAEGSSLWATRWFSPRATASASAAEVPAHSDGPALTARGNSSHRILSDYCPGMPSASMR